jgi:hypothetical protein
MIDKGGGFSSDALYSRYMTLSERQDICSGSGGDTTVKSGHACWQENEEGIVSCLMTVMRAILDIR